MADDHGGGQGTGITDTADAAIKLTNLIDRWFALGRYPLVAIGIGMVLLIFYVAAMQTATIRGTPLGDDWYLIFFLGAGLLLGGFSAAIYGAVRAQKAAHKAIEDYQKTIDVAHRISIESIRSVRRLNELLLIHVDTVAQVLDAARPVLQMLGATQLAHSNYLQSNIANLSNTAQEVIEELDKAIRTADFEKLIGYRDTITLLAARTQAAVENVKAGDWAADQIDRFRSSLTTARDAALAYGDCASRMHAKLSKSAEGIVELRNVLQGLGALAPMLNMSGVNRHLQTLVDAKALMDVAEAANQAVCRAVSSPRAETLQSALKRIDALRAALSKEAGQDPAAAPALVS